MSTVTRMLRTIARGAVGFLQDLAAAPRSARGDVFAAGLHGSHGSLTSDVGGRP